VKELEPSVLRAAAQSNHQPARNDQNSLLSDQDENPKRLSPNSSVSERISSSGNKERDRFRPEWDLGENTKEVLVIDDDADSAFAIKACLESYQSRDQKGPGSSAIRVTTYMDPVKALLEFRPYHYDLVLVDINMPGVNGYELVEKVVKLDLNIKVCFMSSGEMNYEAIREIRHPTRSFGCFIKKPASSDYLVNRVVKELF
jgi:CheY-like chemotaxis protein